MYIIFPLTLVLLAFLSTATSSATFYVLTVFFNGFVTGAGLNYTLAHVLHLTPSSTHYITTSLLATFRGFAGSFGSAVGGGMFIRVLRASLMQGFRDRGFGKTKDDLVRRLLGSPALVGTLDGVERVVAVKGYEDALRNLFLAGAGLAALMVLVQAGTGWRGAKEEQAEADWMGGGSHQDEER